MTIIDAETLKNACGIKAVSIQTGISEDHEHWASMHIAWVAEFDHMETTGVRYDD